jgi:ERF superfamily
MNQLPMASGYQDVILRAAQDPNFDVDKLERLVAMQEAREQRVGDQVFNEALAKAEAEMKTIISDASNPQTRSRFATFARLDGAIREIYTRHGFGISFNTEPSGDPNTLRTVGWLTNGMISRRYQWDNPIETRGAKGTEFTTRTWATSSAFTYAKRILLTAMFNLAISDNDDDGAAAGGRRPAPAPASARPPPSNRLDPNVNPLTGEVVDETCHPEVVAVTKTDGESWHAWGHKLMWLLRNSTSLDEVDRWLEANQDALEALNKAQPATFETLRMAIAADKERFLQ